VRPVTVPDSDLLLEWAGLNKNKKKMAGVFSAHLVPVDCRQLQPGMYVAELDRPWLQTPFHAHGFLLASTEQIETLRRFCSYVYVDPVLSGPSENEMFSTGLTARVTALKPDAQLSTLDYGRQALHATSHALDAVLREARRSAQITLGAPRMALKGLVSNLLSDSDALPWLIATELHVGFLHRRALGSAVLMMMAGQHIGFERRMLDELALAGLLLDIGKISVPITILAKPAHLVSSERHFITRHVRRGLYMVRAAEAISATLEEALLGHHERLDGSGYPRGIRGTHLPLAARLAGIVDTYDALLQTRSYSPALAAHDAIRLINSMRNRQFDSALVRTFILALGIWPTGSWVQLADGRFGIVRKQTPGEPGRPSIALICDSTGGALKTDTMPWRPRRHGDIARGVLPGQMHVSKRIVDAAVSAAAHMAA
jgi:HD-GYP domain-containing protein (c-di-GMP phosphodiesterase class II)